MGPLAWQSIVLYYFWKLFFFQLLKLPRLGYMDTPIRQGLLALIFRWSVLWLSHLCSFPELQPPTPRLTAKCTKSPTKEKVGLMNVNQVGWPNGEGWCLRPRLHATAEMPKMIWNVQPWHWNFGLTSTAEKSRWGFTGFFAYHFLHINCDAEALPLGPTAKRSRE